MPSQAFLEDYKHQKTDAHVRLQYCPTNPDLQTTALRMAFCQNELHPPEPQMGIFRHISQGLARNKTTGAKLFCNKDGGRKAYLHDGAFV